MLQKYSLFFVFSFFFVFANDTPVSPPASGSKIKNEHLNGVRGQMLNELVPRDSNSILTTNRHSLGTSTFRFNSLYINSGAINARDNVLDAVSNLSSIFTLSNGISTSEVLLASVSIQSFGEPIFITYQVDSTSLSVAPDTGPSVGFVCNGQSSATDTPCHLILKRDSTTIYDTGFGPKANADFAVPSTYFNFVDTPVAGTYSYSLYYKVEACGGAGGCELDINGNHKMLAVGL